MRDELWMKHDARSRLDPKMLRYVALTGAAGYGLFWALIETLHYQNDHVLSMEDDVPSIGEAIGLTQDETIRMVGIAHSCRLFKLQDGVLWQEKLKQEQAERSRTKQNAGRLGGLKSGESRRQRPPPQFEAEKKDSEIPEEVQGETKQRPSRHEATKLEEREEREEREEKEENIHIPPPQKSKQKQIPGLREGTEQYGEYRHVYLKPKEYEILVKDYGQTAVESKITHLDSQIENGIKLYVSYKNHAACVNNWCSSDRAQGRTPKEEPLPKGYTWVDRQHVRGPDGEVNHITFLRNMIEGQKLEARQHGRS